MSKDRSKARVGILVETPFLPVSASVKKSIDIARKALQDQGYEVVDVEITPEEFAEGRNLVVGMMATGKFPHLNRDFKKTGERLITGMASHVWFMTRSPATQWLFRSVLKLAG